MAVNHEAPITTTRDSPWNKITRAYSKYLPTDRETFPIRFSLTGFIISLFALQLLFIFVLRDERYIYTHAFYVLIASVHFGLYYGLKTGKLRLATPWVVWKIVEVVYIIAAIISGTTWVRYWGAGHIVLAFFLAAADILMMFCLYKNQVENSEVRDFQGETDSKKSTPDV